MKDKGFRQLSLSKTARFLRRHDNYIILTHASPDGDTLGAAYALYYGLKEIGKIAGVLCPDVIPSKFSYFAVKTDHVKMENATVVAVDVADEKLLGSLAEQFAGKVELCIDHHISNTKYAKNLLLYPGAAAACEVMYELLEKLRVNINDVTAKALYTGIATDTGCFRYTNTDSLTHQMAADLLKLNIRLHHINRVNFDIKSRSRLDLEQMALASIRYDWDGRCAIMAITKEMIEKAKASENDLEGLASIPRQIEGVWVGITMREVETGGFKVSIRTGPSVDACNIAKRLGGGGHVAAAGCNLEGPLDVAMAKLLNAIRVSVPDVEKENDEE